LYIYKNFSHLAPLFESMSICTARLMLFQQSCTVVPDRNDEADDHSEGTIAMSMRGMSI
jgi:hypothetical protein